MSASDSNPKLFQLLMALTIFLGGIVTYLVLNKEEYFPTLYAATGHEHPHEALTEETSHITPEEQKEKEEPSGQASVEPPVINTASKSISSSGKYSLIIGSFKSEENARKLLTQIQQQHTDLSPEITPIDKVDFTYYRIVASRSNSYKTLDAIRGKLIDEGFADCWISE